MSTFEDFMIAGAVKSEEFVRASADFVRVLNEEFAMCGYPTGDREVVLANVRSLLAGAAVPPREPTDAATDQPAATGDSTSHAAHNQSVAGSDAVDADPARTLLMNEVRVVLRDLSAARMSGCFNIIQRALAQIVADGESIKLLTAKVKGLI